MNFTNKLWLERQTNAQSRLHLGYQRLILPIALVLLLGSGDLRAVVVTTLSDSFWSVSTYVALTLTIYHYISGWMNSTNRLVRVYQKSSHIQVIIAALLGALPGCGGAIVVTTQFVSGQIRFGSLVAVLTATMGDAAFLLLASQPITGLTVITIGVITGCITGFAINALHHEDFMKPKVAQLSESLGNKEKPKNKMSTHAINLQGKFWKWLLIPASAVALAHSFQIDINQALGLYENTIEWTGALLAISNMFLWSLTKNLDNYHSVVAEDEKTASSHPLQKAAQDTNFITAWVIFAFLAFELTHYFTGWEVSRNLGHWTVWMPAMGIVIGMLPGCGPQILVTSLYLAGSVPFSMQLSNAISNDGDALFPAIAMAPKAALVATLYSSIPAIIVGYGYFWLFEM